MVTKVPKTKVFDGKRYYLQTLPGSGYATERNADTLVKKLHKQGAYARRMSFSILTATEKKYGTKPRTEWHVYARNK